MTTQFELKSLLSVTKENVWKLPDGSGMLNPKGHLLYTLANPLGLPKKGVVNYFSLPTSIFLMAY